MDENFVNKLKKHQEWLKTDHKSGEPAEFVNDDLSDMTFEKVDFSGVVFRNVTLRRAYFKDCLFDYAMFSNSFFQYAKIINCSFKSSKLINCRFEGGVLENIDYSTASIIKCEYDFFNMKHISFVSTELKDLAFTKCRLTDVTFSNSNMQRLTFLESIFRNVILTDCSSEMVYSNECEFTFMENETRKMFPEKVCSEDTELFINHNRTLLSELTLKVSISNTLDKFIMMVKGVGACVFLGLIISLFITLDFAAVNDFMSLVASKSYLVENIPLIVLALVLLMIVLFILRIIKAKTIIKIAGLQMEKDKALTVFENE